MRMFQRSRFQRHLVLSLMLTCFLSGCYKWSGQPTPITRTHENPSTEPLRRAGDVSWRYLRRDADRDHDPTTQVVYVLIDSGDPLEIPSFVRIGLMR